MKESIREKQILDSLCAGQSITINNRSYNLDNDDSIKLLTYIRTLSPDIAKPPFGRDKVAEFIVNYKKLLDEKDILKTSFSHSQSSAGGRKFKLKRLTTFNFRGLQYYNSTEFTYFFEPSSYLLTGFNGSGKSSFLNAIVWAITGQLLWDRISPESPPDVEIKQITNSVGEISSLKKNWPSHISLPTAEQIKLDTPKCWVEVELVDESSSESIIIRRESQGNKHKVTGTETLDSLSVDLSLLMPGRVSHIQFNQDTHLSKLFFQISGLDTLNDYGIFVSSNGISKALTTHINQISKNIDDKKQKIKKATEEFNAVLPEDIKNDYLNIGIETQNRIIRAEKKIQWLNNQASHRLSQLSNVLEIEELLSDKQLSSLGKKIMVAYENIKTKSLSEWKAFRNLVLAVQEWNVEAQIKWSASQDKIKQDLNTAIEWYLKHKQSNKLRLKLIASKLISPTELPDECPLCEMEFPHDHPLRHELLELNQVEDIATRSIEEIISTLQRRLSDSLPNSFQKVNDLSLNVIAPTAFEEEIGSLLDGELLPIKQLGLESIKNLIKDEIVIENNSKIDYSIFDCEEEYDDSVKRMLESFEQEFDFCTKKVLFVSWAQKNLSDYIQSLEATLGFSQSAGKDSFLQTLIRANDIAESAKPIQDGIEKLKSILTLVQEQQNLIDEINFANQVKDSLKPLDIIRNMADELLVEDLSRVENELQFYYEKLYCDEQFTLKKVLPNKSGRNLVLQFWVQYRDVIVEAAPFLNSSRIRALLWSYVFALSKVASRNARGDWLDFTLIDEPLTSLDQEHQRSFAEIVFNSKDSHQFIIASHDLRWPREIQNLSSLKNLQTKCVDCYGLSNIRNTITITDWLTRLDDLWKKWEAEKNIEIGRDYVLYSRIWCEEELKEILIWAGDPPTDKTNLSPLISKLEHALQNDDLYKVDNLDKLIGSLREIESDLQNSHHGSIYRSRITTNEIGKVKKRMSQIIIRDINYLKDTIYYRLGKIKIV